MLALLFTLFAVTSAVGIPFQSQDSKPFAPLLEIELLENQKTSPEKVDVVIYMESQCPDTARFLANQFGPTWNELKDYINVDLVIYGKAHYTLTPGQNGSINLDFKCQNGPQECRVNLFDVCGMDALAYDQSKYVPFVLCCQLKDVTTAKSCADAAGLDYEKILSCSQGPMGKLLEFSQAVKTSQMDPPMKWVPTVSLNGVQNTNAISDFKKELCAVIGTDKPKACSA